MNGTDTVALVTGANKGIGYEAARQLGALGMTVLLGARDPERRDAAVTALRAESLEVHPLTLDVADDESVRAAAERVGDRFGRLDVLVNNAGISGDARQPPGAADLGGVRAVFETNLFGVVRVTDAMLPFLAKSAAGRVVNVSSGTASMTHMNDPDHHFTGMPGNVAYPVSKTALNALTVQYAKHLRPLGVLVNAVAPGACDTDFARDLGLAFPRTAAQGAAVVVRLATLGADGPTGGFFDENGPVPW
ncbi:SDR family oxidoreductase [Microbispora triticiradicis]|uniref:SDR family oxidoreductase n=3 Tax=Microbispora TaxID=2005 RepID=A0ABY3M086_9ACTN|nr:MULTISPECIES: SDR family oxidoreductase [Microbispora]RGA03884.1 SDR family oxidoreductase [Microbispora triticiradicis]TLP58700.1 SDR family oxidoreductase [Microbispora fusca]TYB61601.1 SDR family oxidoreductase [Microbispora tritici]GLW21385.1 dehydrogenase [Microbispora amethystogenes]